MNKTENIRDDQFVSNEYFNHVVNRIYSQIEGLNKEKKSLEERVRKLEAFRNLVVGGIIILSTIGTLLYRFGDAIFK